MKSSNDRHVSLIDVSKGSLFIYKDLSSLSHYENENKKIYNIAPQKLFNRYIKKYRSENFL